MRANGSGEMIATPSECYAKFPDATNQTLGARRSTIWQPVRKIPISRIARRNFGCKTVHLRGKLGMQPRSFWTLFEKFFTVRIR